MAADGENGAVAPSWPIGVPAGTGPRRLGHRAARRPRPARRPTGAACAGRRSRCARRARAPLPAPPSPRTIHSPTLIQRTPRALSGQWSRIQRYLTSVQSVLAGRPVRGREAREVTGERRLGGRRACRARRSTATTGRPCASTSTPVSAMLATPIPATGPPPARRERLARGRGGGVEQIVGIELRARGHGPPGGGHAAVARARARRCRTTAALQRRRPDVEPDQQLGSPASLSRGGSGGRARSDVDVAAQLAGAGGVGDEDDRAAREPQLAALGEQRAAARERDEDREAGVERGAAARGARRGSTGRRRGRELGAPCSARARSLVPAPSGRAPRARGPSRGSGGRRPRSSSKPSHSSRTDRSVGSCSSTIRMPVADRVRRAGGDEDHVAGARPAARAARRASRRASWARIHSRTASRSSIVALEADVHRGARLGLDDDPRLGLAVVERRARSRAKARPGWKCTGRRWPASSSLTSSAGSAPKRATCSGPSQPSGSAAIASRTSVPSGEPAEPALVARRTSC